MTEIKRYEIDPSVKPEEVMLTEKLCGFSFPITRKMAECYNSRAADTEAIVNNTK